VVKQKIYRATGRAEALARDPATRRHDIHGGVGVNVDGIKFRGGKRGAPEMEVVVESG
jgi:hypothetical protein